MTELIQDLRYAARMLRNNLGFTAVAVITLALGIGVNTAMFSVIDAVLLRPLPYDKPEQLVRLYQTEAQPGTYPFTGEDFLDWKAQNHTLSDMTLFGWTRGVNLASEGAPNIVTAMPTEANFFSLLGVRALQGRTWASGEDQDGHDRVAILSYPLWQKQFGGDPHIVGRTIQVDGQARTVVGVLPATFRFVNYGAYPDLWLPQDMDRLLPRGSHGYGVIGRLKPGVTPQEALTDLKVIAANLEKQFPATNYKVSAVVVPLHESVVGKSKDTLTVMMWAVALVLLIACANVANLLLSRAVGRHREMGIRAALGAARSRLVRQLLTESVLLGIAGGAVGIVFAYVGVQWMSGIKNLGVPTVNAVGVNGSVLGFTFGVAVLTGIIFGLVPALQLAHSDVFDELKGGAGGIVSQGRSRRFASDALVVAEMCLALLLLASAGILIKDFERLRETKVGVRSDAILTAAVRLPNSAYPDQTHQWAFEQQFLSKLTAIPGVDSVAISSTLPLEGGGNGYINLRGQPFQPMSGPLVESHAVSPGYFQTFSIPILKGRVFTETDVAQDVQRDAAIRALYPTNRPPTQEERKQAGDKLNTFTYPVVINETMAKTFWPNEDPIGKVFARGSATGPWQEVIGVVGDVKQWGLTQPPQPEAYNAEDGSAGQTYVLHSSLSKQSLAASMRRALSESDGSLALYSVRTMDEVVADQMTSQTLLTSLVGIFSGLALLLAAIGIYGVLSYLVTQRTREIGIRISLGARRGDVLGLVLKRGIKLAIIGAVAGIVAAVAAGKILASVLHGVSPRDPLIIAATAAGLVGVAFVACYIPARRATKVDPLVALRYE